MNQPLRILLADDDEADRLLFKEALKDLKIKTSVHTVDDGVELMEYLKGKDLILPELLFLDLNMPRKNGLECLKEIKANPRYKEIAVVIYSTSASERDIEETFMSGANVYINKPSNYNALKQVLETAVLNAKVYQDPPFNKSNFLLVID